MEESIIEAWTEEGSVEERPTGNMDTMMQSVDFREFNQVLSIASGENFSPLSIFQIKTQNVLHFLPFIVVKQDQTTNLEVSRCIKVLFANES